MIKIVKADRDGRIVLTEEELNRLLKDSYNEGYLEGTKWVQQFDLDKYEKIPYWCRPDYVPPVITCKPTWKYTTSTTTWKNLE